MKQKTLSEKDALILGREAERKLRLNLQLERLQEEMRESVETSNEVLNRNGLGEGRYDVELYGTKRPLGSVWRPTGAPVFEEENGSSSPVPSNQVESADGTETDPIARAS